MSTLLKKTLPFLALLSLTPGCSSYQLAKPDAPPIAALALPPAGSGQVCVVRPHWIAGAVTFVVKDNGQIVGATRGQTYFCYFAEPGLHKITTQSDTSEESTLTVAAGGNYFLHEMVENLAGFVRSRSVWVAAAAAPELVEKCSYRVLVSVPGNEKLPSSPPIARALAATEAGSGS